MYETRRDVLRGLPRPQVKTWGRGAIYKYGSYRATIFDSITHRGRDRFLWAIGKPHPSIKPRAGSGVVRMDPLRFLAGCRTRRLNQA